MKSFEGILATIYLSLISRLSLTSLHMRLSTCTHTYKTCMSRCACMIIPHGGVHLAVHSRPDTTRECFSALGARQKASTAVSAAGRRSLEFFGGKVKGVKTHHFEKLRQHSCVCMRHHDGESNSTVSHNFVQGTCSMTVITGSMKLRPYEP